VPPRASLDERLREVWARAAQGGGTMPSEPALAASLSASRPAVREALVRLEERGYIHRRKGADTVVNASLLHIPARFDRQLDKSELIASLGREPGLQVLSVERSPVTAEEAQEYEIAPGTVVLRVHKMWSADGIPVMLARDSVPVRVAGSPDDVDPARPMFELAVTLSGERAEWEIVWLAADGLGEDDARYAGRTAGEPVLAPEVVGVGRSGRICYWTSEVHLPGAFRYAMVRRAEWP
jgi:GntR family transcriptional regulator